MGRLKKLVALDTSVLILHANDDRQFGTSATDVISKISSGKHGGIISMVAVTEFLSLRQPGRHTRDRRERAMQHLLSWLMNIPNLKMLEIGLDTSIEAARLRQKYGFKTPDALHLACAVDSHADVFVTSDKELKKCREIAIEVLR